MLTTKYDRPTDATLIVRCENGDEWVAQDEDIKKFGLVRRADAYAAVEDFLSKLLFDVSPDEDGYDGDLTEVEPANSIRYMVERLVASGIPFDFDKGSEDEGFITGFRGWVDVEKFATSLASELRETPVSQWEGHIKKTFGVGVPDVE